jgi:hypothetical protein
VALNKRGSAPGLDVFGCFFIGCSRLLGMLRASF